MAPHFLIPLHLQWGNPLWPLWEAGEWRGEQQWPPEHQGGAEPLQQREHSLLFPVLCSIYKKKPNSQRAKKKMTTQVFSGTPTQNTKSLHCLSLLPHFWICLYLHNAAWSMIWRCGINESCLELRVSCVFYVCLFEIAEPGVKVSSELVASVQSLVAVLQQQIDTSGDQGAADTQAARLERHLPKDNVIKHFIHLQLFLLVRTM